MRTSRTSPRFTTSSWLAALGIGVALVWRSRPSEIVVPERPVLIETPAWPDFPSVGNPADAWAEANRTISDWLSHFFSFGGGLLGSVATWLVSGLFDILSAIGSGVGNIFDSILRVASTLVAQVIDDANAVFANVFDTLRVALDQSVEALALAQDVTTTIDSEIARMRREVAQIVHDEVIDGLTGIIDDALQIPVGFLQRELDVLQGTVDGVVDGLDGLIRDAIDNLDLAGLVEKALAAAGIIAAVTTITTWIEECGDPLCRDLGPGSSLGKALQALKGILELIAGVELLNLTEADLERIGRAFAALTSGSLEDFFAGFVEHGETIGEAGAGIVGELSSAGAEALRVLGVPIP